MGAADLTSTGPGAADVAIYIVQIEGDFELRNVSPPDGGPGHPRGTVLRTFIPIHDTGQGGGGGSLTTTTADLSAYGPVHYVYP